VFIFLYAPIVTLMIFSFNKTKSMAVWGGFTFDWYSSLLENDRIIAALYYTVLIAVIASVVATVIGTISAIGINNMKKGPRTLLLNVNYLPVLNPDIVTGISLMTLFAIGGVLF
ncbi:MAG: ABC transporter permease, partial [Clostridium perfringens]